MASNRLRAGLIGIVGAAGIAATASAQTHSTYVMTQSNFVIPPDPVTTIEVWATWTDPIGPFVFTAGNYDLTAGDGAFLSGTNILNGPGSSVGVISGNTISGASNGQIHDPMSGIHGIPDNPILLATYVWTTTDFTPRPVSLETLNTSSFIVAGTLTGATTQLSPLSFSGGLGVIWVGIPPSPSTVSALALGGLIAARRKRQS